MAVNMREGPPDMSAAWSRSMYPLPNHSLAGENSSFSLFWLPSLAKAYHLSPMLKGREAGVRQLSGAQSRVDKGRVNPDEDTANVFAHSPSVSLSLKPTSEDTLAAWRSLGRWSAAVFKSVTFVHMASFTRPCYILVFSETLGRSLHQFALPSE